MTDLMVMNIYYIINGRIPTEKANGYQVSQMCQAFEDAGASVRLLRPRKHLDPRHQVYANNLKDFYSLRRELKVVDVWSVDFPFLFRRLGRFFDRFQFITNLMHSVSYVLGLAVHLRIRKRTSGDLLYLRDVNVLSWLLPFLDSSLKKRVVLELHYLPSQQRKRMRYVRILQKISAVVCITQKMKQDLIDLGFPKEKLWVEHDGVDLQLFDHSLSQQECRRIFSYPESAMIVGYVGNFHTNGLEKGVDDLIKAARFVLAKQPETKFYFVGGPMDRVPKYLKIIEDLGLPKENFSFFDRRPVSQVPASMAACDVLVIPLPWNQYFAFYMSPMKLFEYMSSGRCIVATNVESLKEVLVHEETALLARHSDLGDLAAQILIALENPAMRERLGVRAKETVKAYSWDKRARRILEFIR